MISAVAAEVIDLEFAVPASYSVNVLSDVMIDALTEVLNGIDVGMLTDFNAFAAVVTALEFDMPTPWTAFGCWPMALLDCGRVLQAWMPSNHV